MQTKSRDTAKNLMEEQSENGDEAGAWQRQWKWTVLLTVRRDAAAPAAEVESNDQAKTFLGLVKALTMVELPFGVSTESSDGSSLTSPILMKRSCVRGGRPSAATSSSPHRHDDYGRRRRLGKLPT
nr:hypothetical protein Itr_chr03CG07510 [Ipomoea trifida]